MSNVRQQMAADIFLGRIERDGLVIVTNNAGDIPLGTRFTKLVRVIVGGTHLERTFTEAGLIASVDLTLKEAIIFHSKVDSIPRGWSAGIRLDGNGIEAVLDALRSKFATDFIHLRE